jgi:dipeptidyl aminopeptidase/acylaminoacyl peptidase
MRVSADGGTPETLVAAEPGWAIFPQILPDGKTLLYTAKNADRLYVVVRPLQSGEPKMLFEGNSAWYLPTGHIIFRLTNSDSVFAVPFNLNKLELAGKPVAVIEHVLGNGIQYAVSASGTLAYMPGDPNMGGPERFTLVWVDREGREEPISAEPNAYAYPRISPDGTRLAVTVNANGKRDIWIWDLVRASMTRLQWVVAGDSGPLWSPDGTRIISRASTGGSDFEISSKSADGTGEAEPIMSVPDDNYLFSWSSNGKELRLTPFQAKNSERDPRISPDGRWIAYASGESGQYEVYVRPFPEVSKGPWQISVRGGNSPLWSPEGREIFYRDAESVISVAVETEPVFKPGKPKALFWKRYAASAAGQTPTPMWDISPDGKRFLMIKPIRAAGEVPESGDARRIQIIQNWFGELKTKVPVK